MSYFDSKVMIHRLWRIVSSSNLDITQGRLRYHTLAKFIRYKKALNNSTHRQAWDKEIYDSFHLLTVKRDLDTADVGISIRKGPLPGIADIGQDLWPVSDCIDWIKDSNVVAIEIESVPGVFRLDFIAEDVTHVTGDEHNEAVTDMLRNPDSIGFTACEIEAILPNVLTRTHYPSSNIITYTARRQQLYMAINHEILSNFKKIEKRYRFDRNRPTCEFVGMYYLVESILQLSRKVTDLISQEGEFYLGRAIPTIDDLRLHSFLQGSARYDNGVLRIELRPQGNNLTYDQDIGKLKIHQIKEITLVHEGLKYAIRNHVNSCADFATEMSKPLTGEKITFNESESKGFIPMPAIYESPHSNIRRSFLQSIELAPIPQAQKTRVYNAFLCLLEFRDLYPFNRCTWNSAFGSHWQILSAESQWVSRGKTTVSVLKLKLVNKLVDRDQDTPPPAQLVSSLRHIAIWKRIDLQIEGLRGVFELNFMNDTVKFKELADTPQVESNNFKPFHYKLRMPVMAPLTVSGLDKPLQTKENMNQNKLTVAARQFLYKWSTRRLTDAQRGLIFDHLMVLINYRYSSDLDFCPKPIIVDKSIFSNNHNVQHLKFDPLKQLAREGLSLSDPEKQILHDSERIVFEVESIPYLITIDFKNGRIDFMLKDPTSAENAMDYYLSEEFVRTQLKREKTAYAQTAFAGRSSLSLTEQQHATLLSTVRSRLANEPNGFRFQAVQKDIILSFITALVAFRDEYQYGGNHWGSIFGSNYVIARYGPLPYNREAIELTLSGDKSESVGFEINPSVLTTITNFNLIDYGIPGIDGVFVINFEDGEIDYFTDVQQRQLHHHRATKLPERQTNPLEFGIMDWKPELSMTLPVQCNEHPLDPDLQSSRFIMSPPVVSRKGDYVRAKPTSAGGFLMPYKTLRVLRDPGYISTSPPTCDFEGDQLNFNDMLISNRNPSLNDDAHITSIFNKVNPFAKHHKVEFILSKHRNDPSGKFYLTEPTEPLGIKLKGGFKRDEIVMVTSRKQRKQLDTTPIHLPVQTFRGSVDSFYKLPDFKTSERGDTWLVTEPDGSFSLYTNDPIGQHDAWLKVSVPDDYSVKGPETRYPVGSYNIGDISPSSKKSVSQNISDIYPNSVLGYNGPSINHSQQGNDVMSKLNINTLLALADTSLRDELKDYGIEDLVPGQFSDTLKRLAAEEKEKATEAAAKEVLELIKLYRTTVEQHVAELRALRAREKQVKAGIARLQRALAYGQETANFIPLAATVGVVQSHGAEITKIPEDWTPANSATDKETTPERPVRGARRASRLASKTAQK